MLEIFRSGDKDKFVVTLQRLAVNLQLEKIMGATFENNSANNNSSFAAQTQAFAMAA